MHRRIVDVVCGVVRLLHNVMVYGASTILLSTKCSSSKSRFLLVLRILECRRWKRESEISTEGEALLKYAWLFIRFLSNYLKHLICGLTHWLRSVIVIY